MSGAPESSESGELAVEAGGEEQLDNMGEIHYTRRKKKNTVPIYGANIVTLCSTLSRSTLYTRPDDFGVHRPMNQWRQCCKVSVVEARELIKKKLI
jgi:hypothetical protein